MTAWQASRSLRAFGSPFQAERADPFVKGRALGVEQTRRVGSLELREETARENVPRTRILEDVRFAHQRGARRHGRQPHIVPVPAGELRPRDAARRPVPSGLPVTGVVLVDQIRSVDREARKMQVIGQAPREVLDEIDSRLAPLLSL